METVEQIKAKRKGTRFVDLTGRVFGKLTAISPAGQNKAKQYLWNCICECGGESIVVGSNLIRGNTKACGCVRLTEIGDRTRKHGMVKTRIFKIWAGMRKRCLNPKCDSYHLYGGRGIKICERWDEFDKFYEDMGESYGDHLSLDRIDPDGDYCPENCRWATTKQQNNNRRNNRIVELNGISKTLAQWSESSGIRQNTISNRLKVGWDTHSAIYQATLKRNDLKNISKYLVF